MSLTEEQLDAIRSEARHRLFVAGPGTGKSESILAFIDHAVETLHIDATHIYVFNFTRAATAELKDKIKKKFVTKTELPKVYTLHGFSLRQVLKNMGRSKALPSDFTIADDFDERHIVLEDLKRLLRINRIEGVRELFNKLAANWETLNADRTGWETSFESPEFVGAWQEHRQVYGYVLRSELVYQFKNVLTQEGDSQIEGPIDFLVVDEYQDLNRCDLRVIQELSKKGARLVCAGDDDQSIYAFRFAFPEGIRQFAIDISASKQFQFSQCFRCDKAILDLALSVIKQDYARIPKRVISVSGQPGYTRTLRFRDQYSEATKMAELCDALHTTRGVPYKEMIVLTRSNHKNVFSDVLEEALANRGIPVVSRKDLYSVFDSREGRYLSALAKLALNPHHDLATRTLLQLTQGVGPSSIDALYNLARSERKRFAVVAREVAFGERTDVRLTAAARAVLNQVLASETLQKVRKNHFTEGLRVLMELVPDPSEDFPSYIDQFVVESGVSSLEDFVLAVADFFGPQEQNQPLVDAVRVMTMHQAKGLSANAVFVVAVEEEYMPGRGNVDEERRLLYVSLTRARHFLFITFCQHRTGRQGFTGYRQNQGTRRHLSRYLANIPNLSITEGETMCLD